MCKRLVGIEGLNDVQARLERKTKNDTQVNHDRWPYDDLLLRRWEPHSGFSFEPRQAPMPAEHDACSYIMAHAKSEREKRHPNSWYENDQLKPHSDRIVIASADIVFFEYNEQVYIVFFTRNQERISRIETELIEKTLECSLMSANLFEIDEDCFYWLLYKWMTVGGLVSEKFQIDGLNAFIGSAVEESHRLSGTGERITDLLGTLAFVFGNEPLDSLSMFLTYKEEIEISCTLYRNGSVDFADYSDVFRQEVQRGKEQQAVTAILVYKHIIPLIIALYQQDSTWSEDVREQFVKQTGIHILQRVIHSLKLNPNMTIDQIMKM